jgi:hypothetical protein
MAHSQETKDKLRDDFINKRLPLTTLANKYAISYATAQSWKKQAKENGDNWDGAKSASSIAKGGDIAQQSVQDFEALFDAVYQEVMSSDLSALEKVQALATLSDAKIKTVKAAGMQDPAKAKLGIALETLSELTEFIKLKHGNQLAELVPILLPFGEHINKKWG